MNLTTSRSNVPNMVAELENVELNGLGEASSSQMDSPSSHHIKFSASTKPSEINLCGQASPDTACDSASNDLSTAVSRRLEMLNSAGSSTEEVKLDTAQASLCGVGNIRWSWLQRFATKRWMLFFMCWFCLVQGMICNGLVPSVLSTIELRYGFRTSQVGSLMLFYDVGYIIFCVPVSYFGGRHSKPTFLSVGLLLLAIGSFTFTWPQFVPTKDTHKLEVSTCAADEVARLSAIPETCVNSTLVALERVEADGVRSFYLTLFCIAHFLHGVGATTLYSVGVSYIDENVNPAVSSAYIGVFYAFAIFGPAIGFVLSGRLLLIPANFLTDSSYDSTSATFVGAWWVGFLLTSFLAFIAVLPVLCFPRVLPSALQYHQRRLRVASVRASVRASRSHSRQPSTGNVLAHSSSANNALDKSHHNNSSMPGHHSIISRQESGSGVILPAISLPSSLSGLSDVPTVDTRVTVTSTGNNGVTTKTTVDDEQVCEPEVLEEDVIQDRSQTTVVDMVMTVFPPPQSFDKPLTPHQHMYKVKFQKLCELCTKLWNDLQHIPKAVSRLLTNVTFMLITLAAAFEGILITGVSTYMAKYLERQFSVGASYSSVLLGCIMVPVAGIAAMSSGFVVKHYQLSIMQTLKFCIVACFGCLLLSPMFFVFCDHVPMAGVESDYLDWNHGEFNRTHTPGHQPSKLYQLDNECNLGCKCSPREFHPVCAYGHDGLTRVPYYSPCYAGCPQDWSAQRKEYFNCTCADSSKVRVVLSGVCTPNCTGLVTFLALFVPLCFCTFTIGVPLLSVVLRVVDYNERSFAMGIQWILVRSIGNMPAAVLFGQLFDISCIQRSNPDAGCGDPNKPAVTEGGFSLFKSRTGGTGSCVSYDNRRLAHLFLGFAVVCQTITMLFLIGAAAWYKRAGEPDFDEPSRVMDRENRRHHSNPSSPGRTTSAKKSRNSAKKLSGPGDSTTIESSLATIGENRDVSLPDVAHMDADDGAVQRNGALHNQ